MQAFDVINTTRLQGHVAAYTLECYGINFTIDDFSINTPSNESE